ncbi:unnamed protein product [Caenorhabditis bovis]|uniref:Uncharacterized protein n=1 Tax=Caenorhabditis bovis TaxID=2654633 RepID=A0A8S1F7F1_9PELO|nr:unnamed protein product [Caenorhabditis bovis]
MSVLIQCGGRKEKKANTSAKETMKKKAAPTPPKLSPDVFPVAADEVVCSKEKGSKESKEASHDKEDVLLVNPENHGRDDNKVAKVVQPSEKDE